MRRGLFFYLHQEHSPETIVYGFHFALLSRLSLFTSFNLLLPLFLFCFHSLYLSFMTIYNLFFSPVLAALCSFAETLASPPCFLPSLFPSLAICLSSSFLSFPSSSFFSYLLFLPSLFPCVFCLNSFPPLPLPSHPLPSLFIVLLSPFLHN